MGNCEFSQNQLMAHTEFGEVPSFTHDETYGCLFDMNGIKSDLVESCNKPIVRGECEERLRNERVSNQTIKTVQKEISKIRKYLYYRAFDFVKVRPVIVLVILCVFAIVLAIQRFRSSVHTYC